MTDEKILELAKRYEDHAKTVAGSKVKAECGPIEKLWNTWTVEERWGHILYMCQEIYRHVVTGRMERAERDLAWLQGVFVAISHFTICGGPTESKELQHE